LRVERGCLSADIRIGCCGDPTVTNRPAPLPGQGTPQTVYAVTECIQNRLMKHFEGTGLHWGLRRILQRLWMADGLSQAELARVTRASEASTSNMLKHLVSGGWVERRRDQFDYRISRVYLSEKAISLRGAIEAECAVIDTELRDALEDGEAEHLNVLLHAAWEILGREAPDAESDKGIGIYDQPSPPGVL